MYHMLSYYRSRAANQYGIKQAARHRAKPHNGYSAYWNSRETRISEWIWEEDWTETAKTD